MISLRGARLIVACGAASAVAVAAQRAMPAMTTGAGRLTGRLLGGAEVQRPQTVAYWCPASLALAPERGAAQRGSRRASRCA